MVSISYFASLAGIPMGIMSSAIVSKTCVITAEIIKHKSIIEKKKKKYDKILSLAKSKLNRVEVVFSKPLIDSNISQNKFVLINNVPKEFDNMKGEVINFNGK